MLGPKLQLGTARLRSFSFAYAKLQLGTKILRGWRTMQIGGVILCGGKSSRMGYPKALLPFGPELMLQRMVRLLGEVVSPIVVVAAPEQELPELPPDVLLA